MKISKLFGSNNSTGSSDKGLTISADMQSKIQHDQCIMQALDRVQAIIEFDLNGTIITANQNFLDVLGYTLDEIKGKHHSLFVTPEYKSSSEYTRFWQKLNSGEFDDGVYRRIGKQGKEVWIRASYNPIFDKNNNVIGVVKFASDITKDRLKSIDDAGQISAINRTQAIIEFDLDGRILVANDNFLATMGYSLNEIQGNHHSMFVEASEKNSDEYQQFWQTLRQGEPVARQFKRIGKNGKVVWIQASYNPILDDNGKPTKVVKYATDITGRRMAVDTIQSTIAQLASGDLTCQIEQELDADFAQLREDTNTFVSQLDDIMNDIRDASHTVNGASSEILQGNNELSKRTENQAASVEETASSMEEITSTVRQNADNAASAQNLASSASNVARKSNELIDRVVNNMSSISESSRKIGDIIGVIDSIAFQTNLLALNAAVEAARAGDQGRGFAVVASEVRTLAQRSAEAAKDIKDLISDSTQKVETGNELVDEAGTTMREVVGAIQEVDDLIRDISSASNEQAAGIEEIGKAIYQIDEITQQNAALVEQAAAAAESMQSQAGALSGYVDMFKLSQRGAAPMSAPAPAPAPKATAPRPTLTIATPPPAPKKAPAAVKSVNSQAAADMGMDDDEWETF